MLARPSLTLRTVADSVDEDDASGEIEYLHSDLLGSPRLITDDSGVEVGTCTFDAFGNVASRTGTARSAFGFSGNWTDPGTGLVYLRARDYDPASGQFLTVDPAVDATRQPYAYVGNNPVMLTDPSGLAEWWDFGNYDAENWQDFGAFAAGVAVGIVVGIGVVAAAAAIGACTVATAGLCAVGIAVVAGAVAGAAAGAVTYGLQSGEKSWCGAAEAIGLGALGGALGGVIGAGVGAVFSKFLAPALKSLIQKVFPRLGGGAGSGASSSGWAHVSGIVRDAARGKGNFGLGEGTVDEALAAGRAWVGPNPILASDGKTLLSSDLLRQFRPPSYKPPLGVTQANFESRWVPNGPWQTNGHLTIRVSE